LFGSLRRFQRRPEPCHSNRTGLVLLLCRVAGFGGYRRVGGGGEGGGGLTKIQGVTCEMHGMSVWLGVDLAACVSPARLAGQEAVMERLSNRGVCFCKVRGQTAEVCRLQRHVMDGLLQHSRYTAVGLKPHTPLGC
jgi:hypothetical protein